MVSFNISSRHNSRQNETKAKNHQNTSIRFAVPGFEKVIFKIPYKSGELIRHCLRLLVDAYSARFILRHIRKKSDKP